MKTIISETGSELVKATKNYVEGRYLRETPAFLVYHDFAHTMEVAEAAAEIAIGCKLNNEDIDALKIAAMFHDIGYLESCKEHEKNSADIAAHCLKTYGASDAFIQKVKGCILATSIPQKPENLLEEVLCDADLLHLASPDYSKKAALLRKEWESATGKPFDDEEWRQKNIRFFEAHHFFTDYVKKHFEVGKKENYKMLIHNPPDAPGKKQKKKKRRVGSAEG